MFQPSSLPRRENSEHRVYEVDWYQNGCNVLWFPMYVKQFFVALQFDRLTPHITFVYTIQLRNSRLNAMLKIRLHLMSSISLTMCSILLESAALMQWSSIISWAIFNMPTLPILFCLCMETNVFPTLPLQQPTELFILISTSKYLLLSRPLITFA